MPLNSRTHSSIFGEYTSSLKKKSIILEKEPDITTDPRGVVLTGDAVRSLWKLGIGKHISYIGQGKGAYAAVLTNKGHN